MTNSRKINIFLLICLGVLLWLMFADKCKGDTDTKPPVSMDKIREVIVKDTLLAAKIRDSFTIVLNNRYAIDKQNKENTNRLIAENIQLYNSNEALKNIAYPDTCKEIVNFLNKKYTDYSTQTQRTLSSVNNTIGGLNTTISTQKTALSKKDELYETLRRSCDTCLKVGKEWETYAKKIKPRSYIYAGLHILGERNKILNGYGLEVGLTNKQGTSFGIQGTNINNSINYGISIKKRLFKL